MDAFKALPESLRPLWILFVGLVVLLVVSHEHFGMARRAYMPPDPATLSVHRINIDRVEHSGGAARRPTRGNRHMMAVTLLGSNDWPNITFRVTGAAIGVSFIAPVTYDLYLAKDPQAEADWREKMPNYFPSIEVHGVADGERLLADPVPHYQVALDEKRRLELFGYGALALALIPATVLGFQVRSLWRRLNI